MRSTEPGAASVYEAADGAGRAVWLKIAAEPTAWDRRTRWRFQRLARRRARLQHPNLLRVLDSGEIDGRLFVALEWVEARTLAEVIAEGRMAPRPALHVAAGIARALEAGRAAGLVHRDLRPESVFVVDGPAPRALLGDFGLTEPEPEPGPMGFSGSQDEVSPEELRGEPVTQASDVYRLGCLLFECLTGTPPFRSELFARVLYAHLHDPPPRVTERNRDLPPAIDGVVERALAKDPRARPATPVALVREAAAALDVPVAPPRRRRGRAGRARRPQGGVAAAALRPARAAASALRPARALAAVLRPARATGKRARGLRARLPRLRPASSRPGLVRRLAVALAAAAIAVAALGIVGMSIGGDGDSSTGNAGQERSQAATRVRSAAGTLMRQLDARRAALSKRFESAPNARRRSAAAARIAGAYRDAALDLAVARRSAQAGRPLERVLRRAALAWTALAREARTGRGPRYRAARREADAAERATTAERARL